MLVVVVVVLLVLLVLRLFARCCVPSALFAGDVPSLYEPLWRRVAGPVGWQIRTAIGMRATLCRVCSMGTVSTSPPPAGRTAVCGSAASSTGTGATLVWKARRTMVGGPKATGTER